MCVCVCVCVGTHARTHAHVHIFFIGQVCVHGIDLAIAASCGLLACTSCIDSRASTQACRQASTQTRRQADSKQTGRQQAHRHADMQTVRSERSLMMLCSRFLCPLCLFPLFFRRRACQVRLRALHWDEMSAVSPAMQRPRC